MNEGAFALLDCLGFKRIWEKVSAEQVIQKLEQVTKAAERTEADGPKNWAPAGALQTKFSFLSDTVVVAVHPTVNIKMPDVHKGWLVRLAALLCALVAKEFLRNEPVLTLRGCVTYGQFLIKGNFIVGPAVDESAAAERLAEGAFMWLTPTASELYDKATKAALMTVQQNQIGDVGQLMSNIVRVGFGNDAADLVKREFNDLRQETKRDFTEHLRKFWVRNAGDLLVLRDYPVLMKGTGTVNSQVINPCIAYGPRELPTILPLYRSAMQDDDLSVELKRKQTEKFLSIAVTETQEMYNALAPMVERIRGELMPWIRR